jgi:hypothetical protein
LVWHAVTYRRRHLARAGAPIRIGNRPITRRAPSMSSSPSSDCGYATSPIGFLKSRRVIPRSRPAPSSRPPNRAPRTGSAGAARHDPTATTPLPRVGWPARSGSCASSTMGASPRTSGAPLLVVSQFTLYADTRKGRRPSWSAAAPAEVAEPLVEAFCAALRSLGAKVQTGVFGAMAGELCQRRAGDAAAGKLGPQAWLHVLLNPERPVNGRRVVGEGRGSSGNPWGQVATPGARAALASRL